MYHERNNCADEERHEEIEEPCDVVGLESCGRWKVVGQNWMYKKTYGKETSGAISFVPCTYTRDMCNGAHEPKKLDWIPGL